MRNVKYDLAKALIASYTEEMKTVYEENQKMIDLYLCYYGGGEAPVPYDDYKTSLKFIRTWDIIQSDILNQAQRNLILLHYACDGNLDKTLNAFNGDGSLSKGYKNKASLRVMLCNIRKIIKAQYFELYGDN